MNWLAKGATVAAVTAVGAVVGQALARHGGPARWQVVTINRSLAELTSDGGLPEPIRLLGDGVEVVLRPAPGGRGTELAARPRAGEPDAVLSVVTHLTGDDPRQALRWALYQTKQLAETGELLSPNHPGTTRPIAPTPGTTRPIAPTPGTTARPAPGRT